MCSCGQRERERLWLHPPKKRISPHKSPFWTQRRTVQYIAEREREREGSFGVSFHLPLWLENDFFFCWKTPYNHYAYWSYLQLAVGGSYDHFLNFSCKLTFTNVIANKLSEFGNAEPKSNGISFSRLHTLFLEGFSAISWVGEKRDTSCTQCRSYAKDKPISSHCSKKTLQHCYPLLYSTYYP